MNGAQSLLAALIRNEVDVCFMNPGTSEMHFVAALDDVTGMRGVLALFEGVATGAADGYARMAQRPASVLVHLGPGLGNGLANLHNARRAGVPMILVVGDHATTHAPFDAPLQSDIETVARNVSSWIAVCEHPDDVAGLVDEAMAAAMGPPARIATLIVPADVSWSAISAVPVPGPRPTTSAGAPDVVAAAAALTGAEQPAILIGGSVPAHESTLRLVAGIAATTGARLLTTTFPTRQRRGAGLPAPERLAYLAEMAVLQLADVDTLLLVDAADPVSFFAYPGRPSRLAPDGCNVVTLAPPGTPGHVALRALADLLAVDMSAIPVAASAPPGLPSGPLNAETMANALGALLPAEAIVVDEANTSGLWCGPATAGAPAHDWLYLTGGAIGYALPAAIGAATACPDRRVICLEADGSSMYNLQALWTMARERLDVTTVILDNGQYAILNMEMSRVGAGEGGPRSRRMLDLGDPAIDFVQLAAAFGVEARRADTAESFVDALRWSLDTAGPTLVHAVLR